MILLRKVLTVVVACAAILSISSASANNGIQFYEFDFAETLYIDCLDEFVDIEEHISGAFHVFTTPSGNFHVVDNWKFSVMWTGVSTGRVWIGQLTAPYQFNAGPAMVEQFSVKGVQKPITEGAPKFFWTATFKTTVNANGEVVVLNDPGSYSVRCLGKN